MENREQAMEYVDRLILDELRERARAGAAASSVLDLGCGVGASMIDLAREFDADYHGIAVSRVQADLTDPAYWTAPPAGRFDLAFAVESSRHVEDLLARLPLLAGQIAPEGTLIVVDDMISRAGARSCPPRREQRWLRELEKSWYANGLVGMEQCVAAAGEAGLRMVETRDLTPYLELDRSRVPLGRLLIPVLRRLPLRPRWLNNLLAGNALRLALRSGLLRYYFLVFTVGAGRDSR